MRTRARSVFLLPGFALAVALTTGCQSAYYRTMESLGYHKRDLLVERVEEARDDQQAAKEQFQSALEAFRSVVRVPGGDLRDVYDRIKREHERSEDRAATVRDRISSIDTVATDLFQEWTEELEGYESQRLRDQSEARLWETRDRYHQFYSAMRRAEQKMQPVLSAFGDQVLFLKHNLNAQAVNSLHGEVASLELEIDELVRDMEAAIAEADAFIATMTGGQARSRGLPPFGRQTTAPWESLTRVTTPVVCG